MNKLSTREKIKSNSPRKNAVKTEIIITTNENTTDCLFVGQLT